ncbi:hypothetical protein GF358_01900 [Candidatus Woesearchaeota archaeon]|nr:hypothetical protein [Candidatus Woesearchaeota archaeon]
MNEKNLAVCQKCGTEIQSFSAMRKWCIECREIIRLQQARERKQRKKNSKKSK